MLQKENFETEIKGKKTSLISLSNTQGMQVHLTNYGARIVGVVVPSKNGHTLDVNLGAADIQAYMQPSANYYGAVIGRVSSRIREARFDLDGKTYALKPNNGDTFLHGGEQGFHCQVFDIDFVDSQEVHFSYLSRDGEEGFPGNLLLKVKYELTHDNELKITYEAQASERTPFNVTNHAYFNLDGEGSGSVLDQELQIFADKYLPVKEDILPTGELAKVENTPFDFRISKPIGQDIAEPNKQLAYGSGYDHTFVLSETFTGKLKHAARAKGKQSGVVLDVYTDQPGIHLYTGNFMEGSFQLKSGAVDDYRTAFCLETQHFSDALNKEHFPSIVLDPGKKWISQTYFKFSLAQ